MSRLWKNIFAAIGVLGIISMLIIYLCSLLPQNEIIAAALIHLLAGTLVAFIFLYLVLVFLRPKIEISKYICLRDGRYWFKVYNRSVYHAFEIKIELFRMVPSNHSGGKSNVDIYKVELHTSDWTSINRFRRKYSEKDPFALYARGIFTEEDLKTPLTQKQTYLELQLTARHGLTGLADRFTQQYPNETVIMEGHKFCFGANLDTMPENESI